MDGDTLAIILTVLLAVGAAYAALARKLGDLGERLARLEGAVGGWLNPPPSKPRPRREACPIEASTSSARK